MTIAKHQPARFSSIGMAMPRCMLLAMMGIALAVQVTHGQGLAEAPGSTIGYQTPAAALAALRARKDVTISVQDGWTVGAESVSKTLWSFAPEGYPGYPAVVKRQIIEEKEGVSIKTDVLCQGSKADCDKMVIDFDRLNDQIRAGLAKGQR